MNVGINTYGLREKLGHDFEGTLYELKEQGYDYLEPCIVLEDIDNTSAQAGDLFRDEEIARAFVGIWTTMDAADRLHIVRCIGYKVEGCHIMMPAAMTPDKLREMVPQIVKLGQDMGLKYFVLSLMIETDTMREYVDAINYAINTLKNAGLEFLYHNHDMECFRHDGICALDVLAEDCPDLCFELDLGWLMIGGIDPVVFIEKYARRIKLLHFKDFTERVSSEKCMKYICAVGEGLLPLNEIAEAAEKCLLYKGGLVIGQDMSLKDIFFDVSVGINNLKKAFAI